MVEVCSCCKTIILPDDECYMDSKNNNVPLCDSCSVYNEETDLYERVLSEKILIENTNCEFSNSLRRDKKEFF